VLRAQQYLNPALSTLYDKLFAAAATSIQQRTEVNHVIPKKATAVAETSTIISKVSRLFFDEFLRF